MSAERYGAYSVLMSVYSKENPAWLKLAIESIQDQTLPTSDFVLVCDGPLTPELDGVIAEKHCQMGEILMVVRLEKNVGLGNALNEGIKHCRNELVARMDSDDIAYPDRCEKQVAIFNKYPIVSICSGTVMEFSKNPETINCKRVLPEKNKEIIEFAKKRNPFNHPCVMYEKKNEQIRFGVLCGTIVIIPAEAREALEQAIGMSGKVTFSRIGNLSETDYLKVTAVGNAHFLTGAVTDIFSKGYMQVLIGTKSLLGEGWDSPCINSLILASFVGSFMLSNQMRGRAIRVMKEHPEKTSNIWHLVCLRPWNEVLKADDNQISEDYSMLERRMEHFLGLHYTENTIENGMKRLSVIKTPFNKTNIDRINRQMLKMSGQRDTLKERWNSALAVYDKMDIVDETEVKDKFVTSVVFWDAILTMILSGILCLIGAIGAGIVAAASQNGILAGTCYFFIAAGLAGIMIRFPKIFMLGSPLKRLKAFGNGIRKALEEQQLLEETHCKVETESNGPDNHIIYLSGGSGRDKALFAQCVNEFFDVIDNQRYILVKKKGHKGLNGFYAIPNCFSKKKEDAERFAKCMHPYIGNYDCVYTRNEKGRELLLEGRVKALANREERCISHKKVKGALE